MLKFRALIAIVSLSAASAACGISQEEHDKALADQKAALNGEMTKMQDAQAKELGARDQRIKGLETEVKRLGGTLSETAAKAEGLAENLSESQGKVGSLEEELATLRRQRAQLEAANKQYEDVARKLQSMVTSGKLEVTRRKGRMVLKLPDNILFPSGSDQLKKEGSAAIDEVADVLKDVDRDFIIAGHTDNIPVKKGGRFKSNWDLSAARAVSVVKKMVKRGVPEIRLSASGYGEFDPVGDNKTKEGRATNRRLEIILMPKIEELPQLPK